MLRLCCVWKPYLLSFLFLKFVFFLIGDFFFHQVKKKKMDRCEKKMCLDRQNILLDVQYHPKNFFFIMLFKKMWKNVLGGEMVQDRRSVSYHLYLYIFFSEHLLKCVRVWTQSTSSLNTHCVILLNQQTMQKWLPSQPDRSVADEINGHLKKAER